MSIKSILSFSLAFVLLVPITSRDIANNMHNLETAQHDQHAATQL
jgi:hypothetical protein